jgi:protein-S-isoprenylcysteine O-methyltransferase Ste14
MHPVFKITIATAAYALTHSVFASRTVKRAAAAVVGENNCRAFYRPFYVCQALVATGVLFTYMRSLQTPVLYHVRGVPALGLRAGQLLALLHAYTATREVGVLRITGADGMLLRVRGMPVPEAPVAQGPEVNPATGRLSTAGPFTLSRHPLNFSAVPLFWLTPKLTTGRLAFNIVATMYLALGSLHEERRLRHAYGREYEAYVQSGVPFFVPRLRLIER